MIRFGPLGIPLSSKGRTLKDGVQDVHMLGLSAMEVQFLRVHTNERFASEDEIGHKIREIPEGIIIQVIQEGEQGDNVIWDLNHAIENGDILVSFSSPIAPSYSMLKDIGNLAKELDVMLSLHTPYHMNLCAEPEQARTSILWNIWGGVMASAMDATAVITNIGVPHPSGPAVSVRNLTRNIDEILKQFKKLRINAKIGLQPSPKPEIYGTIDEVLAICKRYDGDVIPILNFPNIHLRLGGALKDQTDFKEIVNKIRPFYRRLPFYAQFAGVESSPTGEIYYSPIKRGELKFDPFAEYLIESAPDMTIISISPLVEHDAMYMKLIYERILAKKEMKKKKIEVKHKLPKKPIPPPKAKPKGKPIKPPAKKPTRPPAKKLVPKKPVVKKLAPKKPEAKKPAPKKPVAKPVLPIRAKPKSVPKAVPKVVAKPKPKPMPKKPVVKAKPVIGPKPRPAPKKPAKPKTKTPPGKKPTPVKKPTRPKTGKGR